MPRFRRYQMNSGLVLDIVNLSLVTPSRHERSLFARHRLVTHHATVIVDARSVLDW
jgi:hypothetical protein